MVAATALASAQTRNGITIARLIDPTMGTVASIMVGLMYHTMALEIVDQTNIMAVKGL